jgi:hypothetical protein
MLKKFFSGAEFVPAECQGALLVFKQCLSSMITCCPGRFQPLAEEVAAGLPPARQGEDWLYHADQANHRRPVAEFGRPFDDSQRRAGRG